MSNLANVCFSASTPPRSHFSMTLNQAAVAPSLIEADNTRNPSYYEPRAIYALPTKSFYEDRTHTSQPHKAVKYTEETFVRGLNLRCGEFYRLREATVPHLIENKLYKQDFDTQDVKWDLYEVYAKVLKHDLPKGKTTVSTCWK
jgi:hypothetical protein